MTQKLFEVSEYTEHGCCHEASIMTDDENIKKRFGMLSGLIAEFFDRDMAEKVCALMNEQEWDL